MTKLSALQVRRYGEDEMTPIVLDDRRICGLGSDHIRKGCIALHVEGHGSSGLIHLTTVEALRLSDLLRAMADADAEEPA